MIRQSINNDFKKRRELDQRLLERMSKPMDAVKTYREENKQRELLEYWEKQSKNPNLTPSERRELSLQMRIAGVTAGDTTAARTAEGSRQFQIKEEFEQRRRDRQNLGQTEEEWKREILKQQRDAEADYRKSVQVVDRELKSPSQIYGD